MGSQEAGTLCSVCGAQNPSSNRFCGTCGTRLDAARSAAFLEERRWATVVFTDLSGFTSMSERLDPEDVHEFARRCVEYFSDQVTRFGGTTVREMGDEILAVFGAPIAHEDDPERAIRAALAMRDAPIETPDGQPVRVHAGINTGEIITTVVSLSGRAEYTVHGDTVNTAARLRSAATSDSILVSEETYRSTAHVVDYRPVPAVEAKGKEQPVAVWEALDVAPLPLPRPSVAGPIIGRDEELALLTGIWAKVTREARPHLVTILGEPGIGKSRLAAELERTLNGNAKVLHGRCPPYGDVVSYWALSTALKEAAGITAEDDGPRARLKLVDLVARVLDGDGRREAEEVAHHLALLGGLYEADGTSRAGADQPTLYAALRRFLQAFCAVQPVVLVLDDIHWADDALLDVIEFIASRVREVPLLVLTQTRPELLDRRPTWGRGVRAFTSLSLEPLDDDCAHQLILTLSAKHGLAPGVAERAGRGAGGNPLFAEELVAMLAQSGDESRIPSAIKALISARIDALPAEERTVMQRAAVFGRVFWEGGLRFIGAPDDLAEQLEALEYKDLLRARPRSRFPGDREYAFKHDLIHDVAFEMLLRADRRDLHGRIVLWIEESAGDRRDEYLDLLAHHAVQAGTPARAIEYLMQAAERAQRAGLRRKEAALLSQAMELASGVEASGLLAELQLRRGRAFGSAALWEDARNDLETVLATLAPDEIERRAEILVDLAAVDMWGYGGATARPVAEEAVELADRAGRLDLVAGAMTQLATDAAGQGDPLAGIELFREASERARQAPSPLRGLTLQGTMLHSVVLYWAGKNDDAIRVADDAVREMQDENESVARMVVLPHLGLAQAAIGRYGDALRTFEEARRFGREYEIWGPLARAISMSAGFHLELFDLVGHRELAEEARELGRSRFPPTLAFTGVDLLLNAARAGEPGRVEGLVDEVAQQVEQATAWHLWLSRIRLNQARAELALARGEHEVALTYAAEAIERSRETSRVKYEALALETQAAALQHLGRTKEAIASLRTAVERAVSLNDPAVLVRVGAPLLALDGDTDLAATARGAVDRILTGLTDEGLRRKFETAVPVRAIVRHAAASSPLKQTS
ncbi:MAG TPA: adenylate/guanylate cyclase domain-containing protein [Chloroflexota bacterium]